MSLTESSNRPGSEAGTATTATSTEAKRTLSPLPLIVVMCMEIGFMLGVTFANMFGTVA